MDNKPKPIYDDEVTVMGDEVKIVLVFKYIASILSLFGSLFIIICYCYLSYLVKIKPKKQNKNQEAEEDNKSQKSKSEEEYKNLKMGYGHSLIFYLSISDFILSIASFVKFSEFNLGIITPACIAQGVLINFCINFTKMI